MSVGGATWDTAGTLDLGVDNTFTVADATESDLFDDQAWWTFNVPAPSRVDLVSSPGSNFTLFSGGDEADALPVTSIDPHGGPDDGVTATYLLSENATYHLVVGLWGGESPTAYQVTYARRNTATSPWIPDLRDNEENILTVVDLDDGWLNDVIRPGSYRIGDVGYLEDLGGPWDISAAACASSHARWGNQFGGTWDGICPPLLTGGADLEIVGNSSVSYEFGDHTGPPLIADAAIVQVTTPSFGIWLKPVEENLPEYGVLAAPDPVAYGFPAGSVIEYESNRVELIWLEIAERVGSVGNDPDTRYAVNYTPQPSYAGGEWGAWLKGFLPGIPIDPPPVWSTGNYSVTFASEAVDEADKTWYPLGVPADGFDSLTQDYLNDPYDFCVIAGPAEAFGDRTLNADRIAPVGLMLRVHVRSPRFRFIYDGPTTVVRQWPRDDARGTSSAPRLWPPPKTSRIAGGYPGGSGL